MTTTLEQVGLHPTILQYTFSSPITHDDLVTLMEQEQQFITSLPANTPFHAIMDMSSTETIHAALFPKLQQISIAHDRRVATIIVVGANPYLRALARSLGFTTRCENMLFCRNMDDALMTVTAFGAFNAGSAAASGLEM